MLEDGVARAATATLQDERGGEQVLHVTLTEGRNREIRRLMEALGLTIHSLKRIAIGSLELGNLARGEWRELTAAERDALGSEASGN